MQITRDTEIYNEKRYGKPWIAKIDFSINKQGDFLWGNWIGEPGFKGLLVLDNVNIGDVIARGQKDNRNPTYSSPRYYIVEENGKLKRVQKVEAYKHFLLGERK